MRILPEEIKHKYLGLHSIDGLFSFPINDFIQMHSFEREEFVIREGSYPEYLYYLVEGRAKVYLTHQNGKVSLLQFIQPGTFIGEMELLNEAYYTKGVQTTAESVCFAIPVKACKDKLLNDPKFLRYLCIFLSDKATRMTSKYSQSNAYPLDNRLAEFILLSSDRLVYKEKHTEACEYLGVSYRHLLFVLSRFLEAGYIEKKGRSYIVKNAEKLQALADKIQYGTDRG
ncbi:MAG: transcriptional regulator YeiL [Bacillus sp. (in: firmicutes)]